MVVVCFFLEKNLGEKIFPFSYEGRGRTLLTINKVWSRESRPPWRLFSLPMRRRLDLSVTVAMGQEMVSMVTGGSEGCRNGTVSVHRLHPRRSTLTFAAAHSWRPLWIRVQRRGTRKVAKLTLPVLVNASRYAYPAPFHFAWNQIFFGVYETFVRKDVLPNGLFRSFRIFLYVEIVFYSNRDELRR